jgi:hypothetical protein
MLSGARNQGNGDLSKTLHDRIQRLFPDHQKYRIASQILLANTYAAMGEQDMAGNVRDEIYQSANKREVSLSWTEANGEVVVSYVFYQMIAVDELVSCSFIAFPSSRSIPSSM